MFSANTPPIKHKKNRTTSFETTKQIFKAKALRFENPLKVARSVKPLKLLISPISEHEALEAVAGGADIVDVKNPKEGALGASFPWIIKRIRAITPSPIEVSCTLGDLPNLPGSVALAAFGAASLGVDYIKCSLYGVRTREDAIHLLKNVVKAAKEVSSSIKVAAAGFADAERVGSINPLYIPQIAFEAGADVAMVDTAVKDGKSLFWFLKTKQLEMFVSESQNFGLNTALAGSLKKGELTTICSLGADIVGLRGAACTSNDRVNGTIIRGKVQELAKIVHEAYNERLQSF